MDSDSVFARDSSKRTVLGRTMKELVLDLHYNRDPYMKRSTANVQQMVPEQWRDVRLAVSDSLLQQPDNFVHFANVRELVHNEIVKPRLYSHSLAPHSIKLLYHYLELMVSHQHSKYIMPARVGHIEPLRLHIVEDLGLEEVIRVYGKNLILTLALRLVTSKSLNTFKTS
jgi:hypothetical protein